MRKIAITRAQIANEFQRDKETITRWLNEIGITHNKALSPSEIEKFYMKWGSSSQLQAHGLPTRQMEIFSSR